jgi:hypothetical protein
VRRRIADSALETKMPPLSQLFSARGRWLQDGTTRELPVTALGHAPEKFVLSTISPLCFKDEPAYAGARGAEFVAATEDAVEIG